VAIEATPVFLGGLGRLGADRLWQIEAEQQAPASGSAGLQKVPARNAAPGCTIFPHIQASLEIHGQDPLQGRGIRRPGRPD
jgi:hypothetical protein